MRFDLSLPDDLSRYVDAIQTYAAVTRERSAAHPGVITAVLASLFLTYAAYRLYDPLPAGTWPELQDSIIFEYIGWYLSQGNRLYLDVWEVKPPLAFEVTAVLALLAGKNVVLYHILNLLANGAAIVLGAAAAAGIVYELTDDPLGAVVAGIVPFTLPFYYYRALIGFKGKYFVIAAGLSCLYFAYRNRPLLAGVAGAAVVGFWQLAVLFPIGALGLCWQADYRDGVTRFLAAGVSTGVIILLPIVLWGAVPAMVTEVLLTPLLITKGHTFSDRMQFIIRILGTSLPVAVIGLAGIAGGIASSRIHREWPLLIVVGWFTIQMVALDFDARPDLFPWFAVVALGVGLVVGHGRQRIPTRADDDRGAAAWSPSGSAAVAAAILVLAALSVGTMGGFGTGNTGLTSPDTYNTDRQLDPEFGGGRTYNATELQYVYWNRVEIPTCRAFGAYTQSRLVNQVGLAEDRPWYEAPCGQFRPVWRAVRTKYGI